MFYYSKINFILLSKNEFSIMLKHIYEVWSLKDTQVHFYCWKCEVFAREGGVPGKIM